MKSLLGVILLILVNVIFGQDLNYIAFHYDTTGADPLRGVYHTDSLADTNPLQQTNFLPGGIRMTCLSGHWLFYENPDYSGSAIYRNGILNCHTWPTSGIPDSLLHVANPSDYTADFVQFFSQVDYAARSNYYYEQSASITETPHSLIVAGIGTQITLHTAENFQGLTVCIENDSGALGVGIDDIQDLIGSYLTFRSVSWGCSLNSYKVIKASQIKAKRNE